MMDLPLSILAIVANITRLEGRGPNHLDGCDRSSGGMSVVSRQVFVV